MKIQLRNLPTPPPSQECSYGWSVPATVGAIRESKGARPATVVRAVGTAPTYSVPVTRNNCEEL